MIDIGADSRRSHSADAWMPEEIHSDSDEPPSQRMSLLAPAAADLDDVDVASRL
jgi:hypothetical protein